jgi:HEAT repeat protein
MNKRTSRHDRRDAAVAVGAALLTIQQLRDNGDVAGLISHLGSRVADHRTSARGAAAEALGDLGAIDAVPSLMSLTTDPLNHVRRCAVTALGKIGDSAASPALIAALSDSWRIVRMAAAQALGEIDDRRAISALKMALSDDDRWVRVFAAEALIKIGATDEVITRIREMARSERLLTRRRKRLKRLLDEPRLR